jgi:cell division protein FtsI (penicillin-binding protein 3)
MREPEPVTQHPMAASEKTQPAAAQPTRMASGGTVILDVEQGGIVVPSFVGKSVRSAIEMAAGSGLDLDVVGSGLAQQQEPAAGAHVAAGSRVVVKFAR